MINFFNLVELVIDYLVMVDYFVEDDVFEKNIDIEI